MLSKVILAIEKKYQLVTDSDIDPAVFKRGFDQEKEMQSLRQPFNFFGVNFAPLSLPLERRLQVSLLPIRKTWTRPLFAVFSG